MKRSSLPADGNPGQPPASGMWWWGFAVAVALALVAGVAAYSHHVPAFVAARGVDKVIHFAMGATLAGLLDGALGSRGLSHTGPGAKISLGAALVALMAGADEYAQRFAVGRSSDLIDFVADLSGVVVGTVVSRLARRVPLFSEAKHP